MVNFSRYMIYKKNYISKNIDDTKLIAETVAEQSKIGDIIKFYGTLGSGKTTFCSFFINYFFKKNNKQFQTIQSPTFNIVNEYKVNSNLFIYHFDLYRIKKYDELIELNIDYIFNNGISLIEWPEILDNQTYKQTTEINITLKNNNRIFNILKTN